MPSKRLKTFIEADKLEKEGKKLKAENRDYVDRLLKKAKGLGVFLRGVSFQERETVKIDDIQLYVWVEQQCMIPILDEQGELQYGCHGDVIADFDQAKWDSLTKVVIDEEKLEQAVEEGLIDLSKLPESCYTRSTSRVVTIDHKKVNNG